MNSSLGWDTVKEFYQKEFGIEEWVVELYANMDILSLCASGASNKDIEEFLEIPEKEIVTVIRETFDFDGWDKALPLNPYRLFCSYDGAISSVSHFLDFVSALSTEFGAYREFASLRLDKIFYICETMYDIERKIQDEWI